MMMILISLYPILYPILIRYCLLGTKPTLCKLLLACEMPHPYGYQLMMMYANVLLNDQTSDRCRNWITKMYIRLKVMSLWVECFCITKIYKEIKKTAMSEFAVIICFSLFLSFTEKKPLRRISAKKRRSEEEKKTMKFKYRHLHVIYTYIWWENTETKLWTSSWRSTLGENWNMKPTQLKL